jgi:glycosyltransferase involved in cell wall biosynthesis
MLVVVDALPAFPGKSGAVGAFRNLLKYAPGLDSSIEWLFMVTPSQQRYYQRGIEQEFGRNVAFRVLRFPESSRFFRLAAQHLVIPRICRALGAQVHFSMNPEPAFGMTGVQEVFKIVDLQFFDVPDQFGLYKTSYRKFMSRQKIRRAPLLIANSEYTKTQILSRFTVDPSKIKVIYEAVDHHLYSCDGDREQYRRAIATAYNLGYPYILYVSSFRPYKNHLALLDAFSLLIRNHKVAHHLVLVGINIGDYKRMVEKAAAARDLTDRVHCLDFIADADLVAFYRAASLSVYPTALETFGIPPLESMACGTPVIVSSLTAVPEISGGGACVVDPNDPEQFAIAMEKALLDGEFRQELIAKGLSWCRQFTWRRNMQETISAIKMLGAN